MGKFFNFFWRWIRFIIAPESAIRRDIEPGLQKKNLPVFIFLSALLLVYIVIFAGREYNLYLPYEISWEWQEVDFPALDAWLYALIWLYVSGLCVLPKPTILLSSFVFAAYFLYGAANRAPVDFGLGFGEVIVYVLSPLLTAGMEKSLSAIWETLHFRGWPSMRFISICPCM